MIHYVTGTLGAGKSMYATRKLARALLEGKVVATNIALVDGWERKILRRAPHYKFGGRRARAEFEREIATRYAFVEDIATLLTARVRGRGEGRGVMILDEAHNEINNREWEERNQKLALRHLTMARKRGWEVYIVSQHKDNTDAAARRVAADEIRLINWRQYLRVPLLGTPLLPFNLFLAQAFPTNVPPHSLRADKVLYRELFLVGWYGELYDTFYDYGLVDDFDEQNALWLPRRDDRLVAAGVPAGTSAALDRASSPVGEELSIARPYDLEQPADDALAGRLDTHDPIPAGQGAVEA